MKSKLDIKHILTVTADNLLMPGPGLRYTSIRYHIKTPKDENIFTVAETEGSSLFRLVTEINEVRNGHQTYTHRDGSRRRTRWSCVWATTIYYNQMPCKNRQE